MANFTVLTLTENKNINLDKDQSQEEIKSSNLQNEKKEIIDNSKNDASNTTDEKESSVNHPEKTEIKDEIKKPSSNDKTKPEKFEVTPPKEEEKQETNSSSENNGKSESSPIEKPKEPTQEIPEEKPKENNPWDDLGISENDYYNKPMWSWARVDFSIDKFGSQDECFKACTQAGEDSGMGYSCSSINSYSGKYLGEMLDLF